MRKQEGIRRKRGKWQAFVRVNGVFKSQTFELATPREDMQRWRETQAAQGGREIPGAGTIAADIEHYLKRPAVQAMPTFAQREAHLRIWTQALGPGRPRHTITGSEIEAILRGWAADGLAPGTIRKRRTALQSFFVACDGKGKHPLTGVWIPETPKPEARAIDYDIIEKAIAAMPTRLSAKRGTVGALSLAPIRARVLAYTGIPPGLLQKIGPDDLALLAGAVRVQARRKGKGIEARTVPLTADGLAAFKAFHAANAYGRYAIQALNRAFKRGCTRVGMKPATVHLYDLRHSFLTQVYRVTRDLATVARLGLHAEGSVVTERYARAAHADVDRAAVEAFSHSLAEQRRERMKPAVAPRQTQARKRA